MPIFAVGIVFVIKVVNNSFDLFESLHYTKCWLVVKQPADFSREIYFMRRTFTLTESQKTRPLLLWGSPPPSMPLGSHDNLLLKKQILALEGGLCQSSLGLRITSDHQLSLSLSLAVTSLVIISLTSPNSSSIWEFVAVFYDAPPPSQVIICIFMEISLFTIWSIYHLSFSSEARWQQWWPHQRLSWGRPGWWLSSQGRWPGSVLWPPSPPACVTPVSS